MPERPSARPEIAALEGYHSPQVDVEVRLNTNESPFPPPEGWVDALADALRDLRLNRYPDRAAGELRGALAARYGVDAQQVFCANGSNEVLQTVLLAYGGPGRTAAVFEPTYAMHAQIARTTGTRVVAGRRGEEFELTAAAVRDLVAAERPDVLFLCSPNNPTGTIDAADVLLTRSELKGISELVRLSRISRRTILQNLSLSLGYNTLTIPLAMMGWINPLLASAAMAGSSVTVVLNSLRQKRQFPA